jgi:hypothetical protein
MRVWPVAFVHGSLRLQRERHLGAAIAAIEDMKREGVIDEYAVGGAMALIRGGGNQSRS